MFKRFLNRNRKEKTIKPENYLSPLQSKLIKDGGKELKERQKRFDNFRSFVEESIAWFKEIQDRRFHNKPLTPLEKSMVMKYETMASQYITDMYKIHNLVTKTQNYAEIPKKKIRQTSPEVLQEKK